MSPEVIIDLFRHAVFLMIILVTVLIMPSLVVGLVVSVFQAATQINEQSLSFIPRLIATFMTLVVTAPFLSGLVIDFTEKVFTAIPGLIG